MIFINFASFLKVILSVNSDLNISGPYLLREKITPGHFRDKLN